MRSLLAMLALIIGIVASQTAGGQTAPIQHAEMSVAGGLSHAVEAVAAHPVGSQADAADCLGCPEEGESREPCVGASSGCSLAFVGLLRPAKPDVQIDVPADGPVPVAELTLGGLALGVDTPPPRSTI